MVDLALFAPFYEAVYGRAPFPWQLRLLRQVYEEGWPATIQLPTSAGKTSLIDIAVFHLALQASQHTTPRTAALRTFFVIDRRVVVDEAAEQALHLAKTLQAASDSEAVVQVREALQQFGGRVPLAVSVLRGGLYRDHTWADEPNQPLLCLSTVDQIGSRLLFRGYQVSDTGRSVQAGFVANDSLLILDEAHLSAAFADTVEVVVAEAQRPGRVCPVRPLHVVKMSATIPSTGTPFRLAPEDRAHPVLRARFAASKLVELREPSKNFEEDIVALAKQYAEQPDLPVLGIVVNTVAAARLIFTSLQAYGEKRGRAAILLTGRNRPYRSQALWQEWRPYLEANPERPVKPVFVVATQTVEVGANLDFHALITESAPLDALRQRFGRLNRLGLAKSTRAAVVRRPKGDPVYGSPTDATWELLQAHQPVDFGVFALEQWLAERNVQDYNTTPVRGPLLFPAHFQLWSQTQPRPSPDPDVAPFLHGPDALAAADVQIVWRADLPVEEPSEWEERVAAAPPVTAEALPLPLGAVRRWLKGDHKPSVSDLEGLAEPEEADRREMRPVLLWRGLHSLYTRQPAEIRPGDTVVVPSSYGGCDRFGWNPASPTPVDDIGDLANNQLARRGMRRFRLRLALVRASWQEQSQVEVFDSLCERLRQTDTHEPEESALPELLTLLPDSFPGVARIDRDSKGYPQILTWPPARAGTAQVAVRPEDGDEEENSLGLEKRITLRQHSERVANRVQRYARACGLAPSLVADLGLAGLLHDLGKSDDRFQAWLCGGSLAQALREPEPLAKSSGRWSSADVQKARQKAGYPAGMRHEAASVLLAQASDEWASAQDPDLVRHLIGVHHGYGRPLLPSWDEEPDVRLAVRLGDRQIETESGRSLARFDSGWVDQFWRLNQRYGYWGLAYLEALLRRADCVESREEQWSE